MDVVWLAVLKEPRIDGRIVVPFDTKARCTSTFFGPKDLPLVLIQAPSVLCRRAAPKT